MTKELETRTLGRDSWEKERWNMKVYTRQPGLDSWRIQSERDMQFRREGTGRSGHDSMERTPRHPGRDNRARTAMTEQWGTGHLGHGNRCDNGTGHPEQISLGRSALQVSLG